MYFILWDFLSYLECMDATQISINDGMSKIAKVYYYRYSGFSTRHTTCTEQCCIRVFLFGIVKGD